MTYQGPDGKRRPMSPDHYGAHIGDKDWSAVPEPRPVETSDPNPQHQPSRTVQDDAPSVPVSKFYIDPDYVSPVVGHVPGAHHGTTRNYFSYVHPPNENLQYKTKRPKPYGRWLLSAGIVAAIIYGIVSVKAFFDAPMPQQRPLGLPVMKQPAPQQPVTKRKPNAVPARHGDLQPVYHGGKPQAPQP